MARQDRVKGNGTGRVPRGTLGRMASALCLLGLCLGLCLGLSGMAAMPAHAKGADKADRGTNPAYLVGEYKVPAGIDATVAPDVATELWAVVFRPAKAG